MGVYPDVADRRDRARRDRVVGELVRRIVALWTFFMGRNDGCALCGSICEPFGMNDTIREIAIGPDDPGRVCFSCLTSRAIERGLPVHWRINVDSSVWPAWQAAKGFPGPARLDEDGRIRLPGRVVSPLPNYRDVLRSDPCAYCHAPSTSVDHIVALSVSTDNKWSNLTGCCAICNREKKAHDLWRFLLAVDRYKRHVASSGQWRVAPTPFTFDQFFALAVRRAKRPTRSRSAFNSPRMKDRAS